MYRRVDEDFNSSAGGVRGVGGGGGSVGLNGGGGTLGTRSKWRFSIFPFVKRAFRNRDL